MIVGERVRLRMAERSDLPRFVTWLNDPEVRAGLALYHPISMASEEKWYEKMIEREPDRQVYVIEARPSTTVDTWTMIGSCSYDYIEWRNRSAEFGIMIGEKSYWSQGFGTETVNLLLKYGFLTLNFRRVWCHVFANNPRAIRSYEKCGFQIEGTMRESDFIDGEYVSVHLMSILRHEWDALHAGTAGS